MEECLRLFEVSASAPGNPSLEGLSLEILAGESLFLLADARSGRRTLFALLAGEIRAERGKLYLKDKRMRRGSFTGCPIYCADRRNRLAESLSLKENLISLTSAKNRRWLIRPGEVKLAGKLLMTYGVRNPYLNPSLAGIDDRILTEMAVCQASGCALFVLDLSDKSLSQEESCRIFAGADCLKKAGVAVMIMTGRYLQQALLADRIAWMKDGRIVKSFLHPKELPKIGNLWEEGFCPEAERLQEEGFCPEAERLQEEGFCSEAEKPQDMKSSQGKYAPGRSNLWEESDSAAFRLIQDPAWPQKQTLPDYLMRMAESRGENCPDYLPLKGYLSADAAYIPEDSQDHLMEDESIGRNLMIVAARVAGSRLGLVEYSVEAFLEKDFREKFKIDKEASLVRDLELFQKKYLTIYRASLLHPRRILLEEPLRAFEEEKKKAAADYIRSLSRPGREVCVSLREPEEARFFDSI